MVIWISVIAAVLAFGLTWLAGVWFIPFLHKLKYGQTILDIGPKWHKAKKQGTPTMGGIMFIIAVSVCFACAVILFGPLGGKNFAGEDRQELVRAVSGLIMAVMFGFMGFLDDFIKVKKKHNEGLTVMQKIVIQVLIIAAYFATLYLNGMTRTAILFPWGWTWELGWLYYPIMGIVILYLVNAVNLTDGIDGLCSCVTVVYMAAFACISGILGMYCETLLALLTAGGCIGFLMWNFPPAKVFMGDTGSMFLGGMVTALAFIMGRPELVFFFGIVYIWDAMTVVIQRVYFKLTHGKRIFRMTPIHHAFEMRGWKEVKIDFFFSLIAIIGVVLGLMYVYMA